jgi:sulfate adenylyltransferase subunit 2
VFPLSNWTEYDIWAYIGAETIELPGIYYAHTRPVFRATACCWPFTSSCSRATTSRCSRDRCGSAPSATSPAPVASKSTASTVDEVIAETAVSRLTERGATRADDRISEAAWKTASGRATSDERAKRD